MGSQPSSSCRRVAPSNRDNSPAELLAKIKEAIIKDVACQQLLQAYPCINWNAQILVNIRKGQVIDLEYARFNPDVKTVEMSRVGHV